MIQHYLRSLYRIGAAIAVLCTVTACVGDGGPKINAFNADKGSVSANESVTLSWVVTEPKIIYVFNPDCSSSSEFAIYYIPLDERGNGSTTVPIPSSRQYFLNSWSADYPEDILSGETPFPAPIPCHVSGNNQIAASNKTASDFPLGELDQQSLHVRVLTPNESQTLSEVTTVWNNLRTAVISTGNPETLIANMHSQARVQYADSFRALDGKLSDIFSATEDFEPLLIEDNLMEFMTTRVIDGTKYAFVISAAKDEDGAWRIISM